MKKLLPFLALCFCSHFAQAQADQQSGSGNDNLHGDRPGKGDNAGIVPQGFYQLEAGIMFENDETNFYSDKVWSLPEVLFRAGVFSFAELRFRGQLTHSMLDLTSSPLPENRFTHTGLNKIMIGTKIQLLENKGAVPQTAFQADFQLPVGDKYFGNNKFEPKLRLNFKNELSEGLS